MAKQSIGEFLATLRKANGYTQQEIADRLGISNRTLSGWECDNVLPDILLLPALAELYGVTVDEIISGERKERNEVSLSNKSEKKILKSKLVRFSMQSWVLLCIIITGILLASFGVLVEITMESRAGFSWWLLLLFVGAVAAILSLAILIAFWKGAEQSVDDSSDGYEVYCLCLRKKLASNLFVLALTSVIATGIVTAGIFFHNVSYIGGIISSVAFGVFAIALFTAGWFLYRGALVKFGDENARQSVRKDKKFFRAVHFWGIFPIALSVVLIIVTSVGCLRFEVKTTVYENNNIEEFVQHMETLIAPDGERHLPLSELAKTAEIGEEFDLGDGYFAVYHRYSFTIYNEQIMVLYGNGNEIEAVSFSVEVPRIFVRYDTGEAYYIYNARYYSYAEQTANVKYWFVGQDYEVEVISCPAVDNEKFVEYDYYRLQKFGDGLAYVHNIVYDYSLIGYSVAFPVIAVDVIVCAVLCVWKRNKYKIKL